MKKIIALSTEIGRGHPNYLDGLIKVLSQKTNQSIPFFSVFDLSRRASKFAWNAVHRLYRFGSQGGISTIAYNLIRSQRSENRRLIALLGRDLRNCFKGFRGLCLVEHPVVARILRNCCSIYYIHGEVAAPPSSAVYSADKIFVPLEYTRKRFIEHNVSPSCLSVTGLMIEPELITTAKDSFHKRLERLRSNPILNIGFFTSGAYPFEHIEKILKAIISLKGKRPILFAGYDWTKLNLLKRKLIKAGFQINYDSDNSENGFKGGDITVVYRSDRIKDTGRAVGLIPTIDIFVAAAHERTNWALGLGIPMFVLYPMIGPFARENFDFAQNSGVIYSLDSLEKARKFREIVDRLRSDGTLIKMAQNGFGKYPIDGFEKTAVEIINDLDSSVMLHK